MGSWCPLAPCEWRVTVGQRLYPLRKERPPMLMLQKASTLPSRRMTQRILVVDDDPRLRDLLDGYLRVAGFDVKTVADGEAMREHLARAPFELIVLDLMLPGEDGLT